MNYQAVILASGLKETFATRSEAEFWAEVVNGMGKMGYYIETVP